MRRSVPRLAVYNRVFEKLDPVVVESKDVLIHVRSIIVHGIIALDIKLQPTRSLAWSWVMHLNLQFLVPLP